MQDSKDTLQRHNQIDIQLDEETAQGMYVNLALVNHTDTEFTIDVVYVCSQPPRAKVRARIISSPKHTKRLMLALQENVRLYEEKHGELDLGATPGNEQFLQ